MFFYNVHKAFPLSAAFQINKKLFVWGVRNRWPLDANIIKEHSPQKSLKVIFIDF